MSRFSDAFLQDLRARTRLVALIGRDVKLARRGQEHEGLCPFHAEKTPSFTVVEAKGFYHCFGCGAHGDAIAYLRASRGWSFAEAVKQLAAEAGLAPFDGLGMKGEGVKPKPVVPRETPEDAARKRAERIAWARGLWARCVLAEGTLAETYLRHRGITLPVPPSIRYHGALKHGDTGQLFPAMVAAVQDRDGRIVGVHRTFLRADGRGKAQVFKPKMMGGICWEAAVRLDHAGPALHLAEGIETALSVQQATGQATWATLSQGNMRAVRLPDCVTSVTLCADADGKPEAAEQHETLLQSAAAAQRSAGLAVSIARPPAGLDFNDLLKGDAA